MGDKEDLILTHIIEIKGTLGGHTEAIGSIQDTLKKHQEECPAVTDKVVERVQKLEGEQGLIKSFIKNSWQLVLFIGYMVYDRWKS